MSDSVYVAKIPAPSPKPPTHASVSPPVQSLAQIPTLALTSTKSEHYSTNPEDGKDTCDYQDYTNYSETSDDLHDSDEGNPNQNNPRSFLRLNKRQVTPYIFHNANHVYVVNNSSEVNTQMCSWSSTLNVETTNNNNS